MKVHNCNQQTQTLYMLDNVKFFALPCLLSTNFKILAASLYSIVQQTCFKFTPNTVLHKQMNSTEYNKLSTVLGVLVKKMQWWQYRRTDTSQNVT